MTGVLLVVTKCSNRLVGSYTCIFVVKTFGSVLIVLIFE